MFYVRHVAGTYGGTAKWAQHKLKTSKVSGKIFTVINYPQDYDNDQNMIVDYVRSAAYEIHKYLGEDLGLRDLLVPNLEPIPNSYSWLLYYDYNVPSLQFWNIFGFLWRLLVIGLVFYAGYHTYSTIAQFINNFK